MRDSFLVIVLRRMNLIFSRGGS
ncbi:hypothetical protein LINGRAHAP2_LOCUS31208 [Linum grandiflorum]